MSENVVKECCFYCYCHSPIEVWDYSQPGVPKSKGFLCHLFEHMEGGLPIYAAGSDPKVSHCEMFHNCATGEYDESKLLQTADN